MDPDPQNRAGYAYPHSKNVKWTYERLQNVAEKLNEWVDKSIDEKTDFLLGDFCFESKLGFLPSYFARYCERCLDLDKAYNRAKEWQEHNISKGALHNKLNGKFASLWLSHAHGWKINSGEEITKKADSDMATFTKLESERYLEAKGEIPQIDAHH